MHAAEKVGLCVSFQARWADVGTFVPSGFGGLCGKLFVKEFENKQGAMTVVTNGRPKRRQIDQLKNLWGPGVNYLAFREKIVGGRRIANVLVVVSSDS
jgi:hypothetical protein